MCVVCVCVCVVVVVCVWCGVVCVCVCVGCVCVCVVCVWLKIQTLSENSGLRMGMCVCGGEMDVGVSACVMLCLGSSILSR